MAKESFISKKDLNEKLAEVNHAEMEKAGAFHLLTYDSKYVNTEYAKKEFEKAKEQYSVAEKNYSDAHKRFHEI